MSGKIKLLVLMLMPLGVMLWVWLSPLAFVPVPWPDDSAFYFVGKDLFQWPPRWVMIPQAPFEPTYRIFNFNTMPLYPILLGLGRFAGIDGSFAIKFWPLIFWALSGSLLGTWLYRRGVSWWGAAFAGLFVAMDPILRWASVLVRPESLIGFCGMAIVLGLTFGFPESVANLWGRKRWWWDPVAFLLAIGAYAHFNAIHLLFPVVLTFILTLPVKRGLQRLFEVGWKTAFYLLPWILTVLFQFDLFIHQMSTQWERLAIHNAWRDSLAQMLEAMIQSLGSPEPWPQQMKVVAWFFLISMGTGVLFLVFQSVFVLTAKLFKKKSWLDWLLSQRLEVLLPSTAWILGAVWLWDSKPEVWFVFYIHLSIACAVGVCVYWLHLKFVCLISRLFVGFLAGWVGLFFYINGGQASRLGASPSWRWETYRDYVSCIDQRLTQMEKDLRASGYQGKIRVWNPTFPDVIIELSRKHPDWEFSRTNDFHTRMNLALEHGRDAEAVVITEMIYWQERVISAPLSEHPEVQSMWMNWKDYYLYRLEEWPHWKPNRYLCQRGRWQAFIYMK